MSEETTIESPLADSSTDATLREKLVGPLDLSEENVELVLDELRPFLISDGGNVELRDIDGGVVVLELIGACGTCPSSSMTMKMGLEKGLMDLIPEILAVEQVARDGAAISEEGISEVLTTEIRPFLKLCGGDVELLSVDAGDAAVVHAAPHRLVGDAALRQGRDHPAVARQDADARRRALGGVSRRRARAGRLCWASRAVRREHVLIGESD